MLTVGGIIQSLFPLGFQVDHYIDLLSHTVALDIEGELPTRRDRSIRTPYHDAREEDEHALGIALKDEIERQLLSKGQRAENVGNTREEGLTSEAENRAVAYGFYGTVPFTPFDLFAIASTLLEKSGAHHHIEAESLVADDEHPAVRVLKPTRKQRQKWAEAADRWRRTGWKRHPGEFPTALVEYWATLLLGWNEPIFRPLSSNSPCPDWWEAALALLAISDGAARDVGFITNLEKSAALDEASHGELSYAHVGGVWAAHAARMFAQDSVPPRGHVGPYKPNGFWKQSLSIADRDHAAILPKARTAQLGCTIRSLSHNLALLPARGSIRATWESLDQGHIKQNALEREAFNILVVPYPYEISIGNFAPTRILMDKYKVGNFTYKSGAKPDETEKVARTLKKLMAKAEKQVGTVHGVVFPELSLSALQFDNIYRYISMETNVEFLCAGLNQHYKTELAGNMSNGHDFRSANEAVMVSFGLRNHDNNGSGELRDAAFSTHRKHHRWRLSESQITKYGLSAALDPSVAWWEDIRTVSRKLPFMVMRDRWVATALICEDLARVDPGQRVVRAVGPNLVLSLVMDGPQLPDRWSSMYATVLADDPGSSVLTLTSLGLVDRTLRFQPKDKRLSRKQSIAVWRDDVSGPVPITLEEGEKAACLTLFEHRHREFTLDGRSDDFRSITLRLGNYITIG